jgi:hypothetical protein
MNVCSFCKKTIAEDEANVCCNCGGLFHTHCPPACCEELMAEYMDGWLQSLSVNQVERL